MNETPAAIALRDALGAIEPKGAFVARVTTPAEDLILEVRGAGRVRLPLGAQDARSLIRVARPARFGYRDRTILDADVRDTWELAKSRVRIDGKRFHPLLRDVLDTLKDKLGLDPRGALTASLHNLLVYEPGQFFAPHQDTEKADDMIGTLLVDLPSNYTGGALKVSLGDKEQVFRGLRSRDRLSFIAYFADSTHEVRPVTSGYRVVLTYNLSFVRPRGRPTAPKTGSQGLAKRLSAFFSTAPGEDARRSEPPDRLVCLLDHEYTGRSLSWERLKPIDAARAAELAAVAAALDYELGLALAEVHEVWDCEDPYWDRGRWGGRRRRSGRHRFDYDDEDEEDDGREEYELTDLVVEEVTLGPLRAASGRKLPSQAAIRSSELVSTRASDELEPFKTEFEPYMGNHGPNVDRWYHRGALVMWPRSRAFVIGARGSASWALDQLARSLSQGELERARENARAMRPFWRRALADAGHATLLKAALAVADGVDDAALAHDLLAPFSLEHITPAGAPHVVALLDRYGVSWWRALLQSWADARRFGARPRWEPFRKALPDLVRKLSASHAGEQGAEVLLAHERSALADRLEQLRDRPDTSSTRKTRREVFSGVAGVLLACDAVGADAERAALVEALADPKGPLPARSLIELLRLLAARAPERLVHLGLDDAYARCLEAVERAAGKERAPDDWSIEAPRRCGCGLCQELADFLVASDERRLEWPLAKERRRHVHGVIDGAELPVSHTTRRTGSPHRLVLEKLPELFQRAARDRADARDDLAWLRTLNLGVRGSRPRRRARSRSPTPRS